jgi:hypothetical protein
LLNNRVECHASGNKKKEPTPLLGVWKRKSVFWDLPYWHILGTPRCLDVMHITKNICESLLATLFNMPDKTKDGLKARHDLIDLNIRHDLQVRQPPQEMEEVHMRKRVKNNEATQEMPTEGQQRMMVKKNYYCPLLLHSKFG